MALRGLLVFAATLLIATLAALRWPSLMVGPGPMLPAHAALAEKCWSCHSPVGGVVNAKCVRCHSLPSIGRDAARGSQALSGFHERLGQIPCLNCHVQHLGGATGPQSFDHSLLADIGQPACSGCHQADVPDDGLHSQTLTACGECHQTQSWSPARFEHDAYFRLDRDHSKRGCEGCHIEAGRYDSYHCFGCHEHQADKMQREHAEEGVSNYSQKCADCHASADEDEFKAGSVVKSPKQKEGKGKGKTKAARKNKESRKDKQRKRESHGEHGDDD